MGLSQVLQLLQNKAHPSQRGGVPIVKTMNRESTGVEDVYGGMASVPMDAGQPMPITEPQQPRTPFVPRVAPTLDASGSNALLQQAQAILAGLGNNPAPTIQAPNNESIALALLPALLGAGTNYIGGLGQGYMAGQNQELARIEQERRRREQNAIRQAQGLQNQAGDLMTRENALFNQENQNFRNEADNARMLTNTEMVQSELNKRFGMGDQTKRDIAGNRLELDEQKLELDRERVEVGNAVKLWALALKEANMDGQVTANDVARLESLRKEIGGDKYAARLVIPDIGSSWAKIKQDSDMVYKQLVLAEQRRRNQASESVAGRNAATRERIAETAVARENRLSGVLGGSIPGVSDSPTPLPTVSRKEAGRQVATANGSIRQLRAKQKVEGDLKKRARYEIDIKGLAAKRDYYQGLLSGEVPPMNPGEPKTAEGKAAAEKARAFIGPIKPKINVQAGTTTTGKSYNPRGK